MKTYLILIFALFSLSGLHGQDIYLDEEITLDKGPWYIPAAEITGLNILVNRFDLYVLGADWADVSPSSWKENIKTGFRSDGDQFSTNFFAHPYHGAAYFNSARSMGYSYWESIPFTVGGSLMWEFLGETEPASEIDINTTVFGGIYLGEMTNRLSRAILHDHKRKSYHTLRNIGATILNPMGQFNSWINDDVSASFRTPHQETFKLRSEFSMGINFPLKNFDGLDVGTRANINYALLYGDIFKEGSYKPFDSFIFRTWLDIAPRSSIRPVFFNVVSHAPVYRKIINDNSVFSISQHYDFIENQIFKLGGMSLTGDYNFKKDMETWGFVGAAKAGIMLFGSSSSDVLDAINVDIEEEFKKDYVYGRGYVFKLEYMIYTENYGRLTSIYNHWYINTENFVQGVERTALLQVNYYYPVTKAVSIGLEFYNYNRDAGYQEVVGFESINETYRELKFLTAVVF
jgi:hypothetical protein